MLKKKSLEITIPVYNEEKELKENILKLYKFAQAELKDYGWHITIVDNASVDRTPRIGEELEKKYKEISFVRLRQKGRGQAVKKMWLKSKAKICSYMDLDLSTELKHFPNLIKALSRGFDIAIGSRLLPASRVINRTLKREIISRVYNLLIKLLFQVKFSDAQCGFKAVKKEAVEKLIPHIRDDDWFMDSEFLIVAEKLGYKIYEEPVTWKDNPGSTVRVLPTAIGDLKGLLRLFIVRPWNMIKSRHERNKDRRD